MLRCMVIDKTIEKKHFTLVELLVVIAVIAILASLLLPALRRAKRTAYKAVCASQMKQQYIAASNYASDSDDRLPRVTFEREKPSWSFTNDFMFWMEEYCRAPVKQHSNPIFSSTVDKGIMKCVSSLHGSNGMESPKGSVDYWLCGFGPGARWQSGGIGYNYTCARFSKATETLNGYQKSFILEGFWFRQYLPSHLQYLYEDLTCHFPSSPEGMNVCAGDGSVNFVPFANLAANNPIGYGRAMPLGYYTAIQYTDRRPSADRTELCVVKPNGTADNSRDDTTPDKFWGYMKAWGCTGSSKR